LDIFNFEEGVPQFACPSNGELHPGAFGSWKGNEFVSNISQMENFAKKCKEDAVYPSRDNNTIKNCIIKNFYYGIYTKGTINTIITNNLAEQNSDTIIFLNFASNNTLISVKLNDK